MFLNWVTSVWISFTILCSGGVWTAAWHACGDTLTNLSWFSDDAGTCTDEGEACGNCCSSGVISIAPTSGCFHSTVNSFLPLTLDVPPRHLRFISFVAVPLLVKVTAGKYDTHPPGWGRPIDFLTLISVFRI